MRLAHEQRIRRLSLINLQGRVREQDPESFRADHHSQITQAQVAPMPSQPAVRTIAAICVS